MGDEPKTAAVFCPFRPVKALDVISLIHSLVFCRSYLTFYLGASIALGVLAAEPPILHGDRYLKSPDFGQNRVFEPKMHEFHCFTMQITLMNMFSGTLQNNALNTRSGADAYTFPVHCPINNVLASVTVGRFSE